jgi:hypothetical protein
LRDDAKRDVGLKGMRQTPSRQGRKRLLVVGGAVLVAAAIILALGSLVYVMRLASARRSVERIDKTALAVQDCVDRHLEPGAAPKVWTLVARACKEENGAHAATAQCLFAIKDRQSAPEWLAAAFGTCNAGDWAEAGP